MAAGPAYFNTVDIYDASTGRWTTAALSRSRSALTATSLPSQGLAMFAGGYGELFVWILVMKNNVFGLVKGVLLTGRAMVL